MERRMRRKLLARKVDRIEYLFISTIAASAGSSGAAALNDYLKSAMKRRRGGYEDESEL